MNRKITAFAAALVCLALLGGCGEAAGAQAGASVGITGAGAAAGEHTVTGETAVGTTGSTAMETTERTAAQTSGTTETVPPPTVVTTGRFDRPTSSPSSSVTESLSKTRPPISMLCETEKEGLLLRVASGYQHHYTGEPFTVKASITNTTLRTVNYGVASGASNMHFEIPVTIPPGFIDMDTYGKLYTADFRIKKLKPGETFTETIRFLPGTPRENNGMTLDLENIEWFPAGQYTGTAVFTWFTGTAENPGKTKRMELAFPINLI